MFRKSITAGLFVAALSISGAAIAADLAQPAGEVVLSVSGQIGTKNSSDGATFDMDMLKALPATTFTTSTIWTDGQHEFTGVELKTLADALGVTGSKLRATAINDYAIEVPLSDAVAGGPIIAYAMDGEAMSVRDKGPLWLIYPFDSNKDYQAEVYYSRSIWQLDRLEAIE